MGARGDKVHQANRVYLIIHLGGDMDESGLCGDSVTARILSLVEITRPIGIVGNI